MSNTSDVDIMPACECKTPYTRNSYGHCCGIEAIPTEDWTACECSGYM